MKHHHWNLIKNDCELQFQKILIVDYILKLTVKTKWGLFDFFSDF